MLPLFIAASLLAAGLLFLVQPMVAKLLLPILGGSPAVWTTCMVFFQVTLLAGYAYAHGLTRMQGRWQQVVVHGCVLVLAALTLPIGLASDVVPQAGDVPALWLLSMLATIVGLPFFALASAGPLLQRWFSRTGHRWANDPYFLYAAGNAGSMLGLLGYPFLVEPSLGVSVQLPAWSYCFAGFALLAIGCGLLAARGRTPAPAPAEPAPPPGTISRSMRLRWVLLAFVPSSLMLGVTQHISTDVATTPLIWVLPLAIYLLTFMVAFTRRGRVVARQAETLVPVVAVHGLAALLMLELETALRTRITLHLAGLFIVGLACHGRLAKERPDPRQLTGFYLLLAVGGALGGIFNALLAPLLFDWIAEYPIALVLACALRWPVRSASRWGLPLPRVDDAIAVVFLIALLGGLIVVPAGNYVGAPLLAGVCLLVAANRWRFVVCLAILFLAPRLLNRAAPLYAERSFFGVHEVRRELDGSAEWHHLYHGTTIHGSQYMQDPWAAQPTRYYTRSGPMGDVEKAIQRFRRDQDVACIGLGSGTMALLGDERWSMTFYEIDPAVVRIARDPTLFTALQKSKGPVRIVVGDGRLELARSQSMYDGIIVDAFSSDSIPVHLITKEAVQVYLSRLRPGGILTFHISNRYLDLRPVLGRIAAALGLTGVACLDLQVQSMEVSQRRKMKSEYVVLARRREDVRNLVADRRWKRLQGGTSARIWTDDYSNVISTLR